MQDTSTLKAAERWQQTAESQVDDIGGWRNHPNERQYRYFGWLDEHSLIQFDWDTTAIVTHLVQHCPKLDTQPVQDIYAAVSSWTRNRDTADLPTQPILFGILEQAMRAVAVIVAAVTGDARRTQELAQRRTVNASSITRLRELLAGWRRHWAAVVSKCPDYPDAVSIGKIGGDICMADLLDSAAKQAATVGIDPAPILRLRLTDLAARDVPHAIDEALRRLDDLEIQAAAGHIAPADRAGGDILIRGGDGGPTGPRGNVYIIGGDAGPDGPGGAVVIQAGSGRQAENRAAASPAVVSSEPAVTQPSPADAQPTVAAPELQACPAAIVVTDGDFEKALSEGRLAGPEAIRVSGAKAGVNLLPSPLPHDTAAKQPADAAPVPEADARAGGDDEQPQDANHGKPLAAQSPKGKQDGGDDGIKPEYRELGRWAKKRLGLKEYLLVEGIMQAGGWLSLAMDYGTPTSRQSWRAGHRSRRLRNWLGILPPF